jgi:hypothetical protein
MLCAINFYQSIYIFNICNIKTVDKFLTFGVIVLSLILLTGCGNKQKILDTGTCKVDSDCLIYWDAPPDPDSIHMCKNSNYGEICHYCNLVTDKPDYLNCYCDNGLCRLDRINP